VAFIFIYTTTIRVLSVFSTILRMIRNIRIQSWLQSVQHADVQTPAYLITPDVPDNTTNSFVAEFGGARAGALKTPQLTEEEHISRIIINNNKESTENLNELDDTLEGMTF
jgi:hypothetical protein